MRISVTILVVYLCCGLVYLGVSLFVFFVIVFFYFVCVLLDFFAFNSVVYICLNSLSDGGFIVHVF